MLPCPRSIGSRVSFSLRWGACGVAGAPGVTDLLHVDHHEAIHFGILLLCMTLR